ncbi:hypothetical protein K2173_009325 [Erythroxylum novogranatense]|uniref:KIB1-4 beta-propeller domain-containing protein n=1 Tax=Erythroxylum novogranatense TaxID=1862640 RepID=A0AAV8U718_9ROSI|nr:hypothetical protein K2173_009325 [Erythroxylum novogranatense]
MAKLKVKRRPSTDGSTGIILKFQLHSNKKVKKPEPLNLEVVPRGKPIGGSTTGWLITINNSSEIITLFNTANGAEIQLPPLPLFLNEDVNIVHKAVLSSPPDSLLDDDYVVMIIYGNSKQLACFKEGDETWILLEEAGNSYDDILSHEGALYGVDEYGQVVRCQVDPYSWPPILDVVTDRWFFWGQKLNLAVIEGYVCIVIRFMEDGGLGRQTCHFKVGALTDDRDKGVIICGLSNWAILLGRSHSVALPPNTVQGLKGNCIYFKDDDGSDVGGFRCFNMEDSMIHYPLQSETEELLRIWKRKIVN